MRALFTAPWLKCAFALCSQSCDLFGTGVTACVLAEAFNTFRDDIDVLSLDTVSEEILGDADFLFDLAETDLSLPCLPIDEPLRGSTAAL